MDKQEREHTGTTVMMADRPTPKTAKLSAEGLAVPVVFCPDDGADPFSTTPWDTRTAAIKGEGGEVLFEQLDCEIPVSWSQLATNVVANKYFYGEVGTPEREKSVRQLVHRVCRTIADWGIQDGYFASAADGERFYRELAWLCLHQYASFNSPVWFNVGLYHQYGIKGAMCNWHWDKKAGEAIQPQNPYEYPQASACFIQSVQDNMEDIMELARSEAMLFKFGSGTGTDISTLRSHREKLSGGGKPSGPLSFMRVYDQIAAVVKSGGKTRRAAKMQSIKDWHPDVLEFIECKNREEKKVRTLVEQGYDPQDAYDTVLFQNANLSVRLSDDFMRAVEADQPWTTHWVTNPSKPGPTYQARDMFTRMAQSAWCCGDPGVQYDTTINRWHTCPNSGRINASNPCSEYMFVDDSACNLASINLMKFRSDDGTFDAERFQAACRVVFVAQEILIDHASYPTKKIAANSHRFRPIGLGYSNLGSLIMTAGLPYDSRGGPRAVRRDHGHPARGGLPHQHRAGRGRRPVRCLRKEPRAHAARHGDALGEGRGDQGLPEVSPGNGPQSLGQGAGPRQAPRFPQRPGHGAGPHGHDQLHDGLRHHGHRARHRAGEVQAIGRRRDAQDRQPGGAVGPADPRLRRRPDRIDVAYIDKHDTIEGAPELKPEHLPVFDCAFPPRNGRRSIPWRAHIQMMSAAQPFISGAISKTVNMPKESTPEEVADAYMEGWRLGLKALAIYRDGSKEVQPLSTQSKAGKAAEKLVAAPRRERLPDTRPSITHKFNVSGHEGYVTVGLYPDGRPGELFITMAKEGSTIGGLMDCFGTAVSMSLQYGVPLEVYVNKFSHTRFEPQGFTKNPDIKIAKSLVDYIFRWLGITFLPGFREANKAVPPPAPVDPANPDPGDAETETWPAATKAGGPNAAQGSAKNGTSPNGSAPNGNGHGGPKHAAKRNGTPASAAAKDHVGATAGSSGSVSGGATGGSSASVTSSAAGVSPALAVVGVLPKVTGVSPLLAASMAASSATPSRSDQFASFQTDAPACDNCGAITVRAGNCYLCHNCGSSMGCS